MSEKLEEKALKHYQKGQKHLASGKYKKCEGELEKSIDFFIKTNEIERAEKVSLKLCECYIIEKKFYEAAKAAFSAAELILRHKKYKNAIKHYQSVIDFYEKVDATLEILEVYCFITLCYLAQGMFDEGMLLLKKKVVKSKFPQIQKNKLIQLTLLMMNTILKKDAGNLGEIEIQIEKLNLKGGLGTLLKTVEKMINYYVHTVISITIENEELRAGDVADIVVEVKRPEDLQIVQSELNYDRIFDLVEDKQISADKKMIKFKLRPRIQGDLKIGPIALICQVDEFEYPLKIQRTIQVLPGKPRLVVEPQLTEITTNVGVPVELQMNLRNEGKGECMNISFKLELPEELELIEGSLEKKLHSLGPMEEFLFTFRLLAHERIELKLSATLSYDDLEGTQHTMEIEGIPFVASM